MADFTNFYLASAGAAAALIGLLFVAVSIAPGRSVGPTAKPGQQALAESAFTALVNAFFLSLAGLIPGINLGWVAAATGGSAILQTLGVGWRLLRSRARWGTPCGGSSRSR